MYRQMIKLQGFNYTYTDSYQISLIILLIYLGAKIINKQGKWLLVSCATV